VDKDSSCVPAGLNESLIWIDMAIWVADGNVRSGLGFALGLRRY